MRGRDLVLAAWLDRARNVELVRALPPGLRQKRRGRDIACSCPRQRGSKDTLNISPAKHMWICRRCAEGSGSAIDLMIHTNGAVDVFDAAEKLTGEAKPGRVVNAAQREEALFALQSERAGFDAARAGEDLHQALAGSEHVTARFEAGFASGLKARACDEQERLQKKGRLKRAVGLYAAARHKPEAIAAYFAARGIAFEPPRWMRWHSCIDYWHDGRIIHGGPAIVTPMLDDKKAMKAVHVTWVDMAAPPKFRPLLKVDGARLPTKKMFGHAGGAAMWLTPRRPRMLIGEGLETVAAVIAASPDFGGMAAGALNSFTTLPMAVFSDVREAVLLGDGDSDRATTEYYLNMAAARLKEAGVAIVRIAFAPTGMDFADLAQREKGAV